MGTIKRGILGGFSGKVGNVVGSSWKGIAFMRALPLHVKNPRTLAQRTQRSRFAIALAAIQPLQPIIKTGWHLRANEKSAFNAAMSYTVNNAISGAYPNFSVDYSKILISAGSLTGAVNCATDGYEKLKSNVLWADNSAQGSAQPDDIAIIAILNPAKSEIATPAQNILRAEISVTIQLPGHWDGDNVHVYLGFISADTKDVANSIYLGQHLVRNK